MKTALIIITVSVYVAGSVGLPILSYSCPMTGQTGVTFEIDGSLPACVVGACCETDSYEATVRLEGNVTCCDVTVEGSVAGGQTIASGFKYGVDHHLQASSFHNHLLSSRPHAATTSSNPIARSPINSPLLI